MIHKATFSVIMFVIERRTTLKYLFYKVNQIYILHIYCLYMVLFAILWELPIFKAITTNTDKLASKLCKIASVNETPHLTLALTCDMVQTLLLYVFTSCLKIHNTLCKYTMHLCLFYEV